MRRLLGIDLAITAEPVKVRIFALAFPSRCALCRSATRSEAGVSCQRRPKTDPLTTGEN